MLLKRISMRFCIFVPLKIPFLFVPPPIPILHQLLMWINGSNLPCIIPDSRSLSDDKKKSLLELDKKLLLMVVITLMTFTLNWNPQFRNN